MVLYGVTLLSPTSIDIARVRKKCVKILQYSPLPAKSNEHSKTKKRLLNRIDGATRILSDLRKDVQEFKEPVNVYTREWER